jgi:hypothetical protein
MVLPSSGYKHFHKNYMNRTIFAWKYEFINNIGDTEFVINLLKKLPKKIN